MGHKEDIMSISKSESIFVATSSYDGEIIVWNMISGHIFSKLKSTPPKYFKLSIFLLYLNSLIKEIIFYLNNLLILRRRRFECKPDDIFKERLLQQKALSSYGIIWTLWNDSLLVNIWIH